jgi:GntR family transcriptional regulator
VTAEVVVDPASPLPPYEQVRAQLADLVAAGVLRDGDRLPPIRQLAADLGLAAGTVARAYRQLEAAGLVRTGRGGGTRVVAPAAPPAGLADHADAYVAAARAVGAADADLLDAVRVAARRVPRRDGDGPVPTSSSGPARSAEAAD